MKSILVPVDFSYYAENALKLAIEIARKTNASIYLLHVIEAPATQSFNTMGIANFEYLDYSDDALRTEAGKMMNKLIRDSGHEDVDIQSEIVFGKTYDCIAEHITAYTADLLVMGTKGSSGLEEILVGSTTEKVVRFSECPVLSVPCKMELNKIKKIVFAVDPEESYTTEIEVLSEFQKMLHAKIELLSVQKQTGSLNEKELLQKLNEIKEECQLKNCNINIRKGTSVEGEILNFANELEADLIVMATHGRQGLTHVFGGSTTEDIINHSDRAVLTLSIKYKQ